MKKESTVPTFNLAEKGYDFFCAQKKEQAHFLCESWQEYFGKYRLKFDDFISKLMLWNKNFPYRQELEKMPVISGLYSLNFNRYLGCTTAIKNGTLYRTLDVSAPALGECLHVVEKAASAGVYYNLTWPGFVGVATAIAPNRFALAYNEAPSRWLFKGGSFLAVTQIIMSKNIPPLWLSRQVMESCKTYTEAKKTLSKTPLCTGAIYTLMGLEGEGCIIERTENNYVVYELKPHGYAHAGNHWQNNKFKGQVNSNKKSSIERCDTMKKFLLKNKETKPFSWLKEPIKNDTTRFACELNDGGINIKIL